MTRLVLFLSLLCSFVLVLALRGNQHLPINNDRFNLAEATKIHTAQVEERQKALHPVEEKASEEEQTTAPAEQAEIALDTPELQNGAKIYKQCIVCHGKNGEGKLSQKAPALAGQFDWYLELQLKNMKSKARINAVMDPYLKKLSDQDMKDVAIYLSKHTWPSH